MSLRGIKAFVCLKVNKQHFARECKIDSVIAHHESSLIYIIAVIRIILVETIEITRLHVTKQVICMVYTVFTM